MNKAYQTKLQNLRESVISRMEYMEISVHDEDAWNDAVDTFNDALRNYREVLHAVYNKRVYNINSKLLESDNKNA